jgi:dihydrodipicolinate synthase/N-acetylneuraminate lyase
MARVHAEMEWLNGPSQRGAGLELMAFVQAGGLAAQGGGSETYLPWMIAGVTTVIGSLATAVGITYRGQIKALENESRRKDEWIDKLVRQIGRTADVQDRTVSVVERRERAGR